MIEQTNHLHDFTRRDFLKGGSVATLMTMLGGVELFAQTAAAPAETKPAGPKLKLAVIGAGPWGREILNTLVRPTASSPSLADLAEVVTVCDTYPAMMNRGARIVPGAKPVPDYKTLLEDKDIKAVIVATGAPQHKDIVLAALKAGKHVYCEAPLAHTVEDARAIAAAAKAARQCVFQAGLQFRSDKQRLFLRPFIRSGAIGQAVMARAQFHKKQSWRANASNPQREKEINWRLYRATSPGLVGELGIHAIDQASWFFDAKPIAVSGFGAKAFWKDDRDVPDTVQARIEFPGGVFMNYDATLANSFDGEYEILFGSDAAVMMRDNKAWMFKEVDSPLLGWEVYASKETFYKETGITLMADASKSVKADAQPQGQQAPPADTPLTYALNNFIRNSADMTAAVEDAVAALGDDEAAIAEQLAQVQLRPAAGYVEGLQATVFALKTNEAILTGQRIELKPELYELT